MPRCFRHPASWKGEVTSLADVLAAALAQIYVRDLQVFRLADGRVSTHGAVIHQHAEPIVAHHALQAARDIPPAVPGAVAGLHDVEVPVPIAWEVTREAASGELSGVDGLAFLVDEITHLPVPVTSMDA